MSEISTNQFLVKKRLTDGLYNLTQIKLGLCALGKWGENKHLQEKFSFLHIKPHNKDISDHIQYSAALLWWMVQSWELELLADVTAWWKQQRWGSILSASTLCRKKVVLNDFKRRLAECLVASSDVPALKHKDEQQLLTWKLQEANKEPFPGRMPLFNFVF